MDIDMGLIALIGSVVLAVFGWLFAILLNMKGSGIPWALLKASMQHKLVVEIENKDRSKDFVVPEIKEGYLQLQEWGIGQVLVTPDKVLDVGAGYFKAHPDKVKVTKSGIRILQVSSDLPEGFIAEDVKHGFLSSPQMIDRYNERIADKLAEEKTDDRPENKIVKYGIVIAVIIAVGLVGYMLISKMIEWNQSSACLNALIELKRTPLQQAVAAGLNQTGIY